MLFENSDIDFKISTIHEQQNNMNIKLDNIQNQIQTFGLNDKIKKKDVESDIPIHGIFSDRNIRGIGTTIN